MGRRDQLDLLLEGWAQTRRQLLGITDPRTASGYVGAVRCTLGARRDLHAGSKSWGKVDTHWPEVYQGTAAEVNRHFKRLPENLRVIVDVHYTVLTPKNRSTRAELLGLRRDRYYEQVRLAKAFLAGALGI